GIDSERLGGIIWGAWHLWLGDARGVGISGQAVFLAQPDQEVAQLGIVELQVVQLGDELPGLPRYFCEYAWHLSLRSQGAEPLSDLHNQLLGNIRLRVDCRGLLRILLLRVHLRRANEHAQREHECNDGRPHRYRPPPMHQRSVYGSALWRANGAPCLDSRATSLRRSSGKQGRARRGSIASCSSLWPRCMGTSSLRSLSAATSRPGATRAARLPVWQT